MRLTVAWDGRNAIVLAIGTVCASAILCAAWLPYAYVLRWAWLALPLPAALFLTILAGLTAVLTTALVVPIAVRVAGIATPVGTHSVRSWAAIRWVASNAAVILLRGLGLELLRCTPWLNLYVRLMGARIGDRVIVNSTQLYDLDLLEIGDDSVIGGDAVIMAHSAQEGYLTLAPVRIGRRVTIGHQAVIHGGVEIGDGAIIGAMAFVPCNTHIPPGDRWGGVPARRLGGADGGARPPAPGTVGERGQPASARQRRSSSE